MENCYSKNFYFDYSAIKIIKNIIKESSKNYMSLHNFQKKVRYRIFIIYKICLIGNRATNLQNSEKYKLKNYNNRLRVCDLNI